MLTITDIVPRAWIGCLGCYNEGRLVGEWLEADDLEDEDTLAAICARPDHEELWAMDTEFIPGGEMSPAEAARKARALTTYLETLAECGLPAVVALDYLEGRNIDDPDLWEGLADVNFTAAEGKTEYVSNTLDEYGISLPGWLAVDYNHTFDELTDGETKIRHEGVLYVFHDSFGV
jgi:hypothetical protein